MADYRFMRFFMDVRPSPCGDRKITPPLRRFKVFHSAVRGSSLRAGSFPISHYLSAAQILQQPSGDERWPVRAVRREFDFGASVDDNTSANHAISTREGLAIELDAQLV
jgi:hypothetical protein